MVLDCLMQQSVGVSAEDLRFSKLYIDFKELDKGEKATYFRKRRLTNKMNCLSMPVDLFMNVCWRARKFFCLSSSL